MDREQQEGGKGRGGQEDAGVLIPDQGQAAESNAGEETRRPFPLLDGILVEDPGGGHVQRTSEPAIRDQSRLQKNYGPGDINIHQDMKTVKEQAKERVHHVIIVFIKKEVFRSSC